MKGALGTAELPGSIPLTQPVDRRPGSSSPFANVFNVLLGVALAACAVGTIFVVRSVRRRQAARNKGLYTFGAAPGQELGDIGLDAED